MTPPDKRRWQLISPRLDELLDLAPQDRAERLRAWALEDPALAEELGALLARGAAGSHADFLERPAVESLQQAGPPPVQAGMMLGPYRLQEELGQGGMGSVWTGVRADGRFDGRVAVKFLRGGLLSAGGGGRFAREGQILGKLAHPHIARLLDAGVVDGHPYLVLEHVDGVPIDVHCRERALPVQDRVRLFLDVLAAVAHAHARLVLHRDLKPSNILVTHDGVVKLLDFGIAKLLDEAGQGPDKGELTQLAGHAYTPHYAAPEQVQQSEVTTATDVYALGVLLYRLLGGGHPTAADTQQGLDLLNAVVEQVPRPLSEAAARGQDAFLARQARVLRGDLDTIVAKALKKRPADRYVNAQALSDDLQRWLRHEPISARPDSRLYVLGRFVRRHRWAVSAGALGIVTLLSLTGFSVLQARRAEAAEHQAQARRQEAEDLLGYMLGELADRLRPIGRLELLDSVGRKAQGLLERQEDRTARGRVQRAHALTVIAEVRVAKAEHDEAQQALSTAEKLVQGEPPAEALAADWYRTQGAIAFWQGELARLQRRLDAQERAWRAYQASAQHWLQRRPQDVDALLEVSYAQTNLGSLALLRGRLAEAEQQFAASLQGKVQALQRQPDRADLQADIANSISWLGTVLTQSGQFQRALGAYRQGLEKVAVVRQSRPDDLAWLKKEADLLLRLSEIELELGDRASARAHLAVARAGAARLVKGDPSNQTWLLGQLHTEGLALSEDGLAPAVAYRRLLELLDHLAQLRGGKGAPDSFLPRQVSLLQGAARAGCSASACPELRGHLQRAAAAIQAARLRSSHDLQLLDAAVRLALLEHALRVGAERDSTPACERAAGMLSGQEGWQQVHAGLTRSWLQVQACLRSGTSDTPEMATARQWLSAQRER